MPTFIEVLGIDPTDPADLPLVAPSGTKILYVDATDSDKLKTRDDAGVDEVIGVTAGGDWALSSLVTSGSGLHNAVAGQLVICDPAGAGGSEVELPDPAGLGGKRVAVVNVTDTEDPGQPFGSDDIINITTAAGSIVGNANTTMSTKREFKVFVSDNVATWMRVA